MIRHAAIVITLVACGGNDARPDPTVCSHNPGGGLADFDMPCDPGPNGVFITASGEAFAKFGYDFPPTNPDDVVFVDGWQIRYDHVITTLDHISLSRNPDKSPTDQSLCEDASGAAKLCGTTDTMVAEVLGPFAIDLQKGGPLPDANGADMDATPIAALTGQNLEGNVAFEADKKYAFGFEIPRASMSAKNVNLDAEGVTDYQEMVQKGYTTFLIGTATWLGGSGCTQTAVAPAYDFSVLPTVVHFRIGVPAPTVYRNAQNPALMGDGFPNEEHPRGVPTVANASVIAQATMHIDHAFWESFVHDSPAHFDQYASRYAGLGATANLTLEDFKGYALAPFVDHAGHQVPWRSCLPASVYTAPGNAAMGFDTLSINIDPQGECDATKCDIIRDFYDYTLYNQSTFGHLNADGLSFVDRQYPSPP